VGELESKVGRYIGYLFSLIFRDWLIRHPVFERYLWPIGGGLLVALIIVAFAVETKKSKAIGAAPKLDE
jgi:hypothetical protein